MKALHARNARTYEKIYVPISDATPQSHVFPPSHVDQAQAAVVGARIGGGYLIYVGDVNGEEESDRVILALGGVGVN